MKLKFINSSTILGIFMISLLIGCSKDHDTEDTFRNAQNVAKKGEKIEFNTDARMATIYALQYSYAAINQEFVIEPKSEQLPIFIKGEDALEYINFDNSPYSEKELNFIKEQLYKPESRAILMRNVPHKDGKQIGDIVYVPYQEGLKVPGEFTNQLGAFFDNFEWECRWVHSSFGEIGGRGCHCFHMMNCDYADFCWSCPQDWGDFRDLLEQLKVHPELIIDPIEAFKERLPIPEVPLGQSILNPEIIRY